MESNKESEKIVALAGSLSAKGLLALRFDFACANERSGRFEEITYSSEVEDLRAAFEFLLRYPMQHIGIFGSSMGGTVALLFTAQEAQVACLVTLAAPVHPEKITQQLLSPHELRDWRKVGFLTYHGRRINVTMLEDLEKIDVPKAATQIGCPSLVIHGDRDETVPVAEGHELFSLLPGTKRLVTIEGADHRFSDPDHSQTVRDRALEWFTTHLE
jgi:putative redox protein